MDFLKATIRKDKPDDKPRVQFINFDHIAFIAKSPHDTLLFDGEGKLFFIIDSEINIKKIIEKLPKSEFIKLLEIGVHRSCNESDIYINKKFIKYIYGVSSKRVKCRLGMSTGTLFHLKETVSKVRKKIRDVGIN